MVLNSEKQNTKTSKNKNMKLIVGLGNPEKKYDNTRHNIGFMMVDYLYEEWLKKENFDLWGRNKKLLADVSIGNINGEKVMIAKPLTYMNNSGRSVQAMSAYFKIEPQDIYILHDELDLTLGNYKIQTGKSSAGHNGVESIINQLGNNDFKRVRIGIGKEDKEKQGPGVKFVLNRFGIMEKLKLRDVKKKILEEIKTLV